MKYRKLGSTGINISAVSYGGIVSAGFYGGTDYPSEGQEASDRYVSWAIDQGVNYFDVAPSYGNAQMQLGNSLIPYRDRIHLACKTIETDLEPEFGLAAMKYALSLGVDTLIPPGNFKSFSFAVNHIEECLADPKPDMALLGEKLKTVRGMEFF